MSVKIDSKIDVDLDGSMLSKILFWNIIENIIAPNIPKLNAITGFTFKKAKIILKLELKKVEVKYENLLKLFQKDFVYTHSPALPISILKLKIINTTNVINRLEK